MVDRQDIDALLIGALYGELTPAEEARLQAHLESHPADRGALDDLKSARQAVRESKIFEASAEPPQAISALLLQEAARRAPRKAPIADDKESWFARFVRSFMMHPAMAAAATLVLVVGVAGSLYLAKGDQIADKRAVQEPETSAAPQLAQDQPTPAAGEAAGSGSGFDVGLADKKELAKSESTNEPANKADPGSKADNDREQATKPAIAQAPAAHHATKGIAYGRAEPEPKDLDSAKHEGDDQTVATGADEGQATVGGAATNTGFASPPRGASGAGGAAAGAAPPPPAQQGTVASVPARRPVAAPATTAPTPAPAEESEVQQAQTAKTAKAGNKPAEPIAWARDQHSRAVQLTSGGHCDDASKIVLAIEAKAPAYYADHVATDRALKPCMPYFEGAREKRSEHDRPKAAPVNADESK